MSQTFFLIILLGGCLIMHLFMHRRGHGTSHGHDHGGSARMDDPPDTAVETEPNEHTELIER